MTASYCYTVSHSCVVLFAFPKRIFRELIISEEDIKEVFLCEVVTITYNEDVNASFFNIVVVYICYCDGISCKNTSQWLIF